LIFIIVNKASKRFVYTCEVLFKQVLKTDYRFIELPIFSILDEKKKPSANDIVITYGVDDFNNNCIKIPDCGLLFSDELTELHAPMIIENEVLKLFPEQKPYYSINFDIFSASFYLLTEYYNYYNKQFDLHQRYKNDNENSYFQKPWVNVWADLLVNAIQQKFPTYECPEKEFSWSFSFDIDHPFAFIHRGLIGYLAFFKDLLHADFTNFSLRYKAILTSVDPYNTFDFILDSLDNKKSRFFILVNKFGKYDSHISYHKAAFIEIVKMIAERGHEIGLHPSYFSFLNPQVLEIEKNRLEKIIGEKIVSARQHYLRYRLPQTRQYYSDLEIFNDFNSVCIEKSGFKNAVTVAFPWFDLQKNLMTSLMIHPEICMDTGLNIYEQLRAEAAFEAIEEKIGLVEKYGGNFSMLWHNNSLSEIHGWKGWKEIYLAVLNTLKHKEKLIV